uniref:Uncharacterized protein n=1 Tax=Arundo donax TaxID=35708 RepID=A0A0A8Z1M6_ARUDO
MRCENLLLGCLGHGEGIVLAPDFEVIDYSVSELFNWRWDYRLSMRQLAYAFKQSFI